MRLKRVESHIRIHSEGVAGKGRVLGQVRRRIAFCSRANIPAFGIHEDNQAGLFSRRANIGQRPHPLPAMAFKKTRLRLYNSGLARRGLNHCDAPFLKAFGRIAAKKVRNSTGMWVNAHAEGPVLSGSGD